jgi:hypothetical protein
MYDNSALNPDELNALRFDLKTRNVINGFLDSCVKHFDSNKKNPILYNDIEFRSAMTQIVNHLIHQGDSVIGATVTVKSATYDYDQKYKTTTTYFLYQAVLFMNDRWINYYSGKSKGKISFESDKEKQDMTTHLTLKDWIFAYLADHKNSGFNANDIQSALSRMTVRPIPQQSDINNIFRTLAREGKIVEAIPGTQFYKIK